MKQSKKIFLSILFICGTLISCNNSFKSSQNFKSSFAIVIDSETFNKVEGSVLAYKNMLESEGLKVVIINNEWSDPNDIKAKLKDLYNNKPRLEGAVFIGDVPIPLIMKAQHLTTAYKRDESKYPLHIAAVPSDRFYDDFDLEFNFIEKDSTRSLNFYYELSENSPHYIKSDIYSGRIKPSVSEGDDKYELIKEYLEKVVALRNKTDLDFLMSFTGHGYNSEDLNAWTGEKIALREQFPQLYKPESRVEFLDFSMAKQMKPFLLDRLQDTDLDIALLHEHGAPDMQLISGIHEISGVTESIENVKYYLRSKLRDAKRRGKNLHETKRHYVKTYGVPEEWFEGAFNKEIEEKDSIFNYNLDIYLDDIKLIQTEAKFIMFDACFNGSFHKDRYIAGEYVFGKGSTIVAHANSVNALQDKWPDEMLGLLGVGVRAGNWAKQINTLETHLIGDPTFYFRCHLGFDYNKLIVYAHNNKEVWQELLESDHPDIQSMAIANLFDPKDQEFSKQLKDIYKNSEFFTVRMECLKQLEKYNNEDYVAVLQLAINDPYELIRRLAATMIGNSGRDELIKPLLSSIMNDKYSTRVRSNALGSIDFMNPDEVLKQLPEIMQQYSYMSHASELKDYIIKRVSRNSNKVKEEYEYIKSKDGKYKYRILNIKTLRNYNYHYMVPEYLTILDDLEIEEELRITMIEALAWFTNSEYKTQIIEKCNQLASSDEFSSELRTEALRTVNRLQAHN